MVLFLMVLFVGGFLCVFVLFAWWVFFSWFVGSGFFACFLSIPSDDSTGRLKTLRSTKWLRLKVTSGDHLNSTALLKGDHIQVVFQYLQEYYTTPLSTMLGNQSPHSQKLFLLQKQKFQFLKFVPFSSSPFTGHHLQDFDQSVFPPIKYVHVLVRCCCLGTAEKCDNFECRSDVQKKNTAQQAY